MRKLRDHRAAQNTGADKITSLSTLRTAIVGCRRCEALTRQRKQAVPGDGPVPAPVAFVGIAPGRFGGDRTGVPFAGDRSGRLLRRMIAQAGLRPVFITNLVRCNPKDEVGRNRAPSACEIANCRSHLAAELALVRPRLLVCLGFIVWRELAGAKIPFEPQARRAAEAAGLRLYPMYHPAYVNRGAYRLQDYAADFCALADLVARLDGPCGGRRAVGASPSA